MRRVPPMVTLRALRHAHGLTGEQLAALIHAYGVRVDTDHLYHVEVGRRRASPRLICAWARALHVTRLDIHQAADLRALLDRDRRPP